MSNASPIRRPLRAFVAGVIAALAAAGAQAAQRPLAAAVDVELTAAAAGDTLRAGGRAVLTWRSTDPLAGVEEWEAFLSYDGGATWPVRLTPHLAVDRRRVEVELPPIASADARLLLRFGDERDERELAANRSFAIAAGPADVAALPALAPASGEAARPGLAGVVWWVDGDREGRGLARREVPARGFAPEGPAFRDGTGTAATGDGERAPRLPQRTGNDSTLEAPNRPRPSVPEIGVAAPTGRRLALLSRRNE